VNKSLLQAHRFQQEHALQVNTQPSTLDSSNVRSVQLSAQNVVSMTQLHPQPPPLNALNALPDSLLLMENADQIAKKDSTMMEQSAKLVPSHAQIA